MPPTSSEIKHIIIVDKQSHWRHFSEEALATRGYAVHLQDNYHYPPPIAQTQKPALVILGCATIGQQELKLIERVVANKHHLIVLCTALPRAIMRAIFLKGADDVVDRPYDVDDFVTLIEQVLESIESRNTYQVVKKEGMS